MLRMLLFPLVLLFACAVAGAAAVEASPDPWLTIPGGEGPGKGKKVVLVCGDEEYRSEQTIPELARILAHRHGFDCTVLFAVAPKTGTINPNYNRNIAGTEQLDSADLLIMLIRWRDLPDDQVKHFVDYVESGRPVIGLRTATHPFKLSSPTFAKYTWDSKVPGYEGGFGQQVLGTTWIYHHGAHKKEGTRGIFAPGQEHNPILRGIEPGTIFGTTDVYGLHLPLPGDSTPLVLGQVTETLEPNSKPVAGPKNDPMMPVAWTKSYTGASGKTSRVFTTTMGASQDLTFEGTRRMLVNAVYWTLGMENRIPAKSDVRFVTDFHATMYGDQPDSAYQPGIRPGDLPK